MALRRSVRASLVGLAGLALAGTFSYGIASASGLGIGSPTKADCGGKQYTIGYDTFSDTEDFAVAQAKGIDALAKKLGCVKIVKLVDNADPGTAVQNAKIMVQQHVDGAMLFNVVAAAGPGMGQVLKKAKIPMVSIVVPVPGQTFLAVNEYKAGFTAGTQLALAYQAKNKGTVPYFINGRYDESGKASGIPRMNGVAAGIQKVLKLSKDHVFNVDTKADPPTAQSGTLAVMNRIPSGSKILLAGINDQVSYAMLQAAKQVGRSKDVTIVGIGATRPTGLNFVCQNPQYAGAVGYFPEKWGDSMLPALLARIQGKKVPATVIIPSTWIPRNGLAKAYPGFKCGEKS